MPACPDVSPRFVVHAEALLSAGNIEAAIALCRAGVALYPWYATGYWVLGKCYEAHGSAAAACEQYTEVARRLPGVAAVQRALERASAMQEMKPGALAEQETDVEFILRRLQEAKRVVPPAATEDKPLVDMAAPKSERSIVTVTLAEIYAKQGDYREAIEAYKKLIEQRPEDAGRHAVRMNELEKLLQGADKLRQP